MISVDRIESVELFHALKENWDLLYRRDDEADYFLSWSWLFQLYENSDESVFILGVKSSEDSSEYCAFLPLRREVRFSEGRGRYFNCLSMAGASWADSTGVLCDPDAQKQAIPALAQALKSLSWHRLAFGALNMSADRQALLTEPFAMQNYLLKSAESAKGNEAVDLLVSPFVELPETFDLFLKQVAGSDISRNILNLRRALEQEPALSIEIADAGSIDRYIEFFKGAHVEGGKGVHDQSEEQVLSTYSDLIKAGVLCDEMLVVVMLQNNRPVGLFSCYKDTIKRQLIFYVAAYIDAFEKLQGGLALHSRCIEWAIENNFQRYHLLRGNEPHKYLLGAKNALRSDIEIFRLNPLPTAQLLTHHVKKPALVLLADQSKAYPASSVHKLYSQMLESWPNDVDVLSHYADWLKSVRQFGHEKDIRDFLAEIPAVIDKNRPLDAHSNEPALDIKPFVLVQQWLETLSLKRTSLVSRCSLNVKGLQLEVACSDSDSLDWLRSYLYPLVETADGDRVDQIGNKDMSKAGPGNDRTSSYRLDCIQSSDMVASIMRLAADDVLEVRQLELAGRRIHRLCLSSELIIDICKDNGVVWVSDNAQRQLTLLVSGRTTWPALELARTGRALLIGYLQQEGWLFLHSGAVRFDDKNYLVIGDEGQGKTSLILALMAAGCEFMSNERVFARNTGNGVEALSFPMPVAIGMGTAQQYPKVMEYVYKPESCLYPNRRMNTHRLRATPEAKWAKLSDKVQLLVPELNAAFGHSKALQGGQISGVIVPSIVRDADNDYNDKAKVLAKTDMKKVVSRNHILKKHDSRYPAWLPLAFEPLPSGTSGALTEAICKLPGVRFKYYATKDRSEAILRYPSILRKALHE